MKHLSVTIIGAGVSGLACARKILELAPSQKIEVDLNVLETSGDPGGVLGTVEKNGFLMEEGPDCFITDKPVALELSRKLGLEDQLIRTNPLLKQSFILRGSRLHPIPEGFYLLAPSRLLPLLTTPLLSPWGKLRAALEPFVKVRRDPEDESIGAFVTRRLGREVLESLAQPLIGGVYNADPGDLSLNACLPRFREMEVKHRSLLKALALRRINSQSQVSGARYSLFVSFKKGMKTLGETLASQIPPESLWLHHRVESLVPSGHGTWMVSANGKSQEADAVILALQPSRMAPLLGPLDSEWNKLLLGIPAHDAATLNLGFRREDVDHPLDGFGFVVPAKENKILSGCTFSSQKFEGRAPKGMVLLRAFLGEKAAAFAQKEGRDKILDQVLEELTPILRLKAKPLEHHFAFHPSAMSQFKPGHLSLALRLQQKAEEHRGLYLAGNGFKGVGIPDCVATGEAAAEKLIQDFAPSQESPR